MTFEWKPNRGESEAAYMERLFNEHPKMGIRDLLRIRNARPINAVMKGALTEAIAKVLPPRNDARELELEKENATLRLQLNSMTARVTMMQRLLRSAHNQLEGKESE